jgi:hypothetical protein
VGLLVRIEVISEDCVQITAGESERAAYLTELLIAVDSLLRVQDANLGVLTVALSQLQAVFNRRPQP